MFSRIVPENSAGSWKTTPTEERSSALLNVETSLPQTVSVPAVGWYRPSRRFTRVDLPPPDSPTSATVWPRCALKLTS